jgi:hypothetical protein
MHENLAVGYLGVADPKLPRPLMCEGDQDSG